MTVLYNHDFDADTAGQLPAGWANVVGTWVVSTTNAASGSGLRSSSGGALDAVLYTGQQLTDGTWTFDYKVPKVDGQHSHTISGIFRCSADFSNGYLFNVNDAGELGFYKRSGGNYALIGSEIAMSMPARAAGDVLRVEITMAGNAFAYRLWNITAGGSRPTAAMASTTDGSFASGYCGLLQNIDQGTVPGEERPTADNTVLADTGSGSAATTYTLAGPSSATVGTPSSAFTLTLNGTLGQATTITPSDGGAGGSFTPASVTIAAGSTTGSFTYTPGSTGQKSISATNNRGLANPAARSITASSAPVTIARTNAALRWSPGVWCDDGTSRMSANTGAYVKFAFTGTSLTLLTTALASMSAYPQLRAIIDGVAYDVGLSTDSSFSIATGLADATHSCEIYLRASLWSAGSWWNLANALKITGVRIDAGATVSAPTVRAKVMYCFGDSLTQGYFVDGLTSPANDDALATYAVAIAEALDAEYGQVGWGGSNYAGGGVSDVPPFNTSYALVAAGQSRMTGATFTTQPDYVTVMLGTNGVAAQADVATAITNLRAAAPAAYIFLIVPGAGQSRAQITAAVNAAIAGGDTKLAVIDAGVRYQTGLTSATGPASEAAFDAVHYKRRTNARLAAAWMRQIQHQLEPRRFTVIAA